MGRILARTTEEEGGRLIYSMALNEDFEKTGAVRSDTEDIINRTLTVAGTRVALMFIEQPDGGFKVSFRSRNSIDCSQVAESLGGGGHRAAAGASVDGDSEAALSRVLDVVRAAMR
jgi:phosphoesterase RecJ-like protein